MGYAIFHKTTKLMRSWAANAPLPHDTSAEVSLALETKPDRRTKRLTDTLDGLRDATAQELADYDAAQLDTQASSEYDAQKDLKALALVILDEINLLRGASATTIATMSDRTEAQLRMAFISKRKTL